MTSRSLSTLRQTSSSTIPVCHHHSRNRHWSGWKDSRVVCTCTLMATVDLIDTANAIRPALAKSATVVVSERGTRRTIETNDWGGRWDSNPQQLESQGRRAGGADKQIKGLPAYRTLGNGQKRPETGSLRHSPQRHSNPAVGPRHWHIAARSRIGDQLHQCKPVQCAQRCSPSTSTW